LVMIALVAGIYLNVSARSVAAGVEIQRMQAEMDVTRQSIHDLESQLADLTSSKTMESRAREMGFEPLSPDQIMYIQVPGYNGRQTPSMAPSMQPAVVQTQTISPAFTESLIDWVVKNVLRPSGFWMEVGK
jgi:hypothetical protein